MPGNKGKKASKKAGSKAPTAKEQTRSEEETFLPTTQQSEIATIPRKKTTRLT